MCGHRLLGLAAALIAAIVVVLPARAASVHRHARDAWTLTATAPADHDITVTRATFALRPAQRHPRMSVRLLDPVAPGSVFEAVGVLRPATGRHALTALVVLVNRRPSAALYPDAAFQRLVLAGPGMAAKPVLAEALDPFSPSSQPRPAPSSALCADIGGTVAAADVRSVATRGMPLRFSPAAVIADGFDAACGRQTDPAFTAAVTRDPTCGGPGPSTGTTYCCPPCTAPQAYACPAAQTAIACPYETPPRTER